MTHAANAPRRTRLAAALLLALPMSVFAQTAPATGADPHTSTPKQLDAINISSLPWMQSARDIVRPVEVLSGEKLDDARAATLGQTLQQLPGVQSTSFGPSVGRPIIRGLEGARVQVVSDGMSSGDVSALSADHAISIDPFLADQVEVVKGPATLLYGSGAMGGAVNVTDGRTPHESGERPLSGRVELRGGGAEDLRSGVFRVDGSTNPGGAGFVFHADGSLRETDDLKIPGFGESNALLQAEGETPDPADKGVLKNSASRIANGALGVTWVGDSAHLGMSSSLYDARYGVPGHEAHAHDPGAPEEEGDVVLRMRQTRHTLHGGFDTDGFIRHGKFNYTHTAYTHTEYEGGNVVTIFNNKTDEFRGELVHAAIAGWDGAFGLQLSKRDFDAEGDEAFVPKSVTRDAGMFWLGKRSVGALDLEAGARLERVRVRAEANPALPARVNDRSFTAQNFSAAARWHWTPQLAIDLSLDQSQRAPAAEELYANGAHAATRTIEIGDDRLQKETARRAEIGLRFHSERTEFHLNAYQVNYTGFIHPTQLFQRGSVADAVVDDGLPVYAITQSDARFRGVEAEGNFTLLDKDGRQLMLRAFGDVVRAQLQGNAYVEADPLLIHDGDTQALASWYSSAGNVPRLAPARFGLGLKWQAGPWRASLNGIRTMRQTRVATNESETPGYTLVDAHLAWHRDTASGTGFELFVDGENLLNAEARPHTSYLKDLAPLGGRGVQAGVRIYF